jgi:hypothetical protein
MVCSSVCAPLSPPALQNHRSVTVDASPPCVGNTTPLRAQHHGSAPAYTGCANPESAQQVQLHYTTPCYEQGHPGLRPAQMDMEPSYMHSMQHTRSCPASAPMAYHCPCSSADSHFQVALVEARAAEAAADMRVSELSCTLADARAEISALRSACQDAQVDCKASALMSLPTK